MTVQPSPRDYDLLAPVPTPAGATASPWRNNDRGNLVRDLSDGRVQRGNGEIITECTSCTVPIDTGDTCGFCQSYNPPATVSQRLDIAVNKVDLLRHDLNEELQTLTADAPLLAVVDIVTALGHLKRAAVALDRATDQLEAATAEVAR